MGDAALSPSRQGASTNEAEGATGSDVADAEKGGDSRANPPAVHTAQGDPPAQGPTPPATVRGLVGTWGEALPGLRLNYEVSIAPNQPLGQLHLSRVRWFCVSALL